jgi:hypothetical protein
MISVQTASAPSAAPLRHAAHLSVAEMYAESEDCRAVLKTLADNSIDSVVTDPPYALVSIGKRFGKDGAAPAKSNGATGAPQRTHRACRRGIRPTIAALTPVVRGPVAFLAFLALRAT